MMSKILPKTPTTNMVDAGIKVLRVAKVDWQSEAEYVQSIYKAMYGVSGRKEHETKDQP